MNSVDNVAKSPSAFHAGSQRAVRHRSRPALALPKSSTSRLLKAMAETGLLAATAQVPATASAI